MLTILLVVLTLCVFWLLFRNAPMSKDVVSERKPSWFGPSGDQKEWQGYRSKVFQPFSSQTTFYAIAFFSNFVAAANAISWSTVSEGDYQFIISRFGSYFAISTYDAFLVAGFVALAVFVINWQLAIHCASIVSQYLVRILTINRARFVAVSLVFCSYFSYLLTIGIFWLFHESYSFWQGAQLTPFFLFLAVLVVVVVPLKKTEPEHK